MGDDFARHGHPDRNPRIEARPTVEIGEQQLTELLRTDDGDGINDAINNAIDLRDPSPQYAHTKRRGAPVPPWEEWDDAGPHFASDLVPERADIATIAMRRFRAPVASTIDPPNVDRSDMRTAVAQPETRRRPSTAPPLHRHGVVTMAPLSPRDAPSSSSSNLPAPAQLAEGSERLRSPARLTPAILPANPAPDPYAATYSYQPHLARIQRVPEHEAPAFANAPASEAWESLFDAPPPDEPVAAAPPAIDATETRPPRFAKASEPRNPDDWVVLVTRRTATEAIDPVDIVDSVDADRVANGNAVQTVRIPDIAGLVAAADAQADVAEGVVQTDRITDIASLLAAADAQAAAFEAAAAPAPVVEAIAAEPVTAAEPEPAHIGEIEAAPEHIGEIEAAPEPSFEAALDIALEAASAEAPTEPEPAEAAPPTGDGDDFAIAFEPPPAPPAPPQPAPLDPAAEPTSIEPAPDLDDCRGIAPAGTRSVEIPILTREPADAAHHEPSIIIAAEAHADLGLVATPSLQMWPLEREPDTALSPTAEQVLATALRDLVALDAAMPRNHAGPIAPHPTWIPHRTVQPRHVFASLAVLLVILGVLYAIANVIF